MPYTIVKKNQKKSHPQNDRREKYHRKCPNEIPVVNPASHLLHQFQSNQRYIT